MFKRISNLFRGFLSLFISGVERKNPEALLEVEKENLRTQIGKYNQGLAAHAALCERLMSQVKKLEAEEQDMRAKTSANLKAGNRELAGQHALRLQSVTAELFDTRQQLEDAEKTYRELVQARNVTVEAAKAKMDALKSSIDDLKVKKAMAEMTEMASGMITSIGGSGDTLTRLQDMVEKDRALAAGRARVARDSLNTVEFQLKESEQQALAEQALADFAKREGLAIEAPSAVIEDPDTARTIVKSAGPDS